MPVPDANALSATEVELIDLAGISSADPAARRALVRRIADSTRALGFFSIVNHGIPQETIDGVFEAAKTFFALPLEERMTISLTKSMNYRGYLPMKIMGSDPTIKGNLHESFHMYNDMRPDDPDVLAGKPLHDVNVWPEAYPAFRPIMLDYYARLTSLGLELLRAFAVGLDLPEDTFTRHYARQPMSSLKLMHYPPQDPSDLGDNLGTRPHTDPGAVTIVAQDDVGGLEVLAPSGEWLSVPPIRGAFVVNIGEMMKIWTDGIFPATPHRVINRFGQDRYSVPYFANPDWDTIITPLVKNPHPTPREEPWFATTESKGKPITSGEILGRVYGRIWPTAKTQRLDAS